MIRDLKWQSMAVLYLKIVNQIKSKQICFFYNE